MRREIKFRAWNNTQKRWVTADIDDLNAETLRRDVGPRVLDKEVNIFINRWAETLEIKKCNFERFELDAQEIVVAIGLYGDRADLRNHFGIDVS